ncbi:hypothetical protein D1BOALGB6SA_2520 [Olavius sp. associated proteobacterium Delta 1]|nr:hypothetical protein D1BOALGB6SA_2520 [Olavius sp. associated proteobacterium Delta 1]
MVDKLFLFLKMSVREKIIFMSMYFYRLRTNVLYRHFCKRMGSRVNIIKPIKIIPECISFGNDVTILYHGRIEGITEYAGRRYNPNIVFEDEVKVQQNLHLTCAEEIIIGSNTAIAANVTITDINHRYEDVHIPPEKQPLETSKVMIGANCKIYNNTVILPGTNLGRHNIVGANSVVAGEFPDYCVIGGAPAKIIINYNFDTRTWEKVANR